MYIPSLEYIAGFFDGEGGVSISAKAHKYHKVNKRGCNVEINHIQWRYCAYLVNTNKEVLQSIQSVAGGKIQLTGNRKNANHKPCYRLVFYSNSVAPFLQSIRPFCLIKAKQIEVLLEFLSDFDHTPTVKGYKRIRVPVEVQQKRHRLYLEMLNLNKKGRDTKPLTGTIPIPEAKQTHIPCAKCGRLKPILKPKKSRPTVSPYCRWCFLSVNRKSA